MPPGASRGAGTASGRGRGRGRGRGAAARGTTTAAPLSTDQQLPSTDAEAQSHDSQEAGSVPPATSQTPQAAPSRGGSRFKPKNVRRDEAERKRLEEARNRDLASKLQAEEKELRDEERRARRGRGRGGMQPRGLIRRGGIESGRAGFGRGRGTAQWEGAAKSDPYSKLRYQPRREHEKRVNIDLLNGLTDGHAEDGTPLYQPSRYSQKGTGNLPMGLLRTPHEETEVKVKTQAELEAEDRQSDDGDDDHLFVDSPMGDSRDIGMTDDNEVWHAAPKGQGEVNIKPEPGTDSDSADVEMADIPEAPKAPPSPELKKKPVLDEEGVATDPNAERRKRREKKMAEDPEFLNTTRDIEALLQGLSFHAPVEGQEGQDKDDQLYLFQLPPILPPLERVGDGPNGESETVDLTASVNNANADGVNIKTEEGAEAPQHPTSGIPPGGGYLGQMVVRKSGKVELDWGGTPLSVGTGLETDFLTTAMIIEQDSNVEDSEAIAGTAYGMGPVVGKYVLVPVWDEEEEWDPSLDGIYGDGHGNGSGDGEANN
ncbi:hypothetical protein GGR56DRAFT_82321 [Xylariaceae sp. FL0804]|nr:hypothetical protein GGR56DRAFT_82321 [Xylariaceae sp. FL0804]